MKTYYELPGSKELFFTLSTSVIASGIALGVCDSKDVEIGKNLEFALNWGPSIAYGIVGGIISKFSEEVECVIPGGKINVQGNDLVRILSGTAIFGGLGKILETAGYFASYYGSNLIK